MAFKQCISFATDLAANFGCNRFRIIPDIVSKHLRATIWSSCAVLNKSEQTPFLGQVAFHLLPIGLQTLVQNHAWHRFQPFAPPSEVAVLFYSNLSRRLSFDRSLTYYKLDLLLCTGFYLEHAVLFLCHIFAQRWMNDCKIEQSNGRCFALQQLLAFSIKNFISHGKKVTCRCQISKKH